LLLLARYQSQSGSTYANNSGSRGNALSNSANFRNMALGIPTIGLPGDLTFIMSWGRRRSDLDFSVLVPASNGRSERLLGTSSSTGSNVLMSTSDGWNASNDIKRGPGAVNPRALTFTSCSAMVGTDCEEENYRLFSA